MVELLSALLDLVLLPLAGISASISIFMQGEDKTHFLLISILCFGLGGGFSA